MNRTQAKIFFDEPTHKYTDEYGNSYSSVTTIIGSYEHKFSDKEWDIAVACSRIGKNPRHPKYARYANKSARQIIAMWKDTSDKALNRGNKRHNYLEDSVKTSTGFRNQYINVKRTRQGNTLYTIDDILQDHDYGVLDLVTLRKFKVHTRYPKIYEILKSLVEDGWKLYAEIGVYSVELLISGLIDILAVKGNDFIIVDWKTNKSPLQFEGGYYEKDNKGNITSYKITGETMKPPLSHLQQCDGIKYSIQICTYATLVESFGLNFVGGVICHILHCAYTIHDNVPESWLGKEKVDIHEVLDLRQDVSRMIDSYVNDRQGGQLKFGSPTKMIL